MKLLTLDESKALLTKGDLQKLEAGISDKSLKAELINGVPVVTIRKQQIPLFIVLELIGTL